MSAVPLRVILVSFAFSLVGASLSGCIRDEKFTQRRARAWCEHAVDCGSFKSISDCMGVVSDDFDDPYLEASIDSGRIDYDARAARKCVRAIKKLKCLRDEDQSEVEARCAEVFVGRVAPDEPCFRGAECAGELSVCATVPGSCSADDSCCPGVCRYIPDDLAKGDDCSGAARCGDGLFCASGTVEDPQRRCVQLPSAGQACPEGRCEEGTFCDVDTCAAKRAEGGACDRDSACIDDFCAYDWMNGSGECAKRAKTGRTCDVMFGDNGCERERDRCIEGECTERKVGDECDGGYGYSGGDCPDYAHCVDGKCTKYRYAGDSCDDDDKRCYGALDCLGAEDTAGRECGHFGESSPPPQAECSVPE